MVPSILNGNDFTIIDVWEIDLSQATLASNSVIDISQGSKNWVTLEQGSPTSKI